MQSITGATGTRIGFEDAQVELIHNAVGHIPYADYVYCLIYTGYRPFEFLVLDALDYNREERCIKGGGKTEAGKDRPVTISPKILPIVSNLVANKVAGPIFCGEDGKTMPIKEFREHFYAVLDAIGIPNPILPDRNEHTYTPYSCRHTFATMMKRVQAADKDKLALMGHTSAKMLRHYQDVNFEDLRQITDKL